MAAAIDASVLVSVGVKDAGDGDSHCHDIQQILFVVGQKGFSGVRKIYLLLNSQIDRVSGINPNPIII